MIDDYDVFIEKFKDQILVDISRDEYRSAKIFISSIVDMLEYNHRINRNYHDKLVRYGMYYSLTKYYPNELRYPGMEDDIKEAIKAKNEDLEFKNKKIVMPIKVEKPEVKKIKPINDDVFIRSNNSYDKVMMLLEMYQEYGILSSNIDVQRIAVQIVDSLKQANFSEEDILRGNAEYPIKYMIFNLHFDNEFTSEFDSFRKETLDYLVENRKVSYLNTEGYARSMMIASELASIFKMNGIERKDFVEDATDKYIENFLVRDLIRSNSVHRVSVDYKEVFYDKFEDAKNFHSKIKAIPKEKKIDAAVISIRIFLALIMLKMVQTLGNYIYDNALEKRQERQRENRAKKPKYEYSVKSTSNDGYYAIDELLHGQYNLETNEFMIGSDDVAKL